MTEGKALYAKKEECNKDKGASMVRNNYSNACERLINRQVNMEMFAAYWYKSLQHHFDREDVALKGFVQLFKEASAEEMEHADAFMVFQTKRGGQLKYTTIEPPPSFEWTAAIAVAESIELEKQVTKSIEEMATQACQDNDHHLSDFLCSVFLTEQYQALKNLANLLTRIKRAGPGVGIIIVDKELQEEFKDKQKQNFHSP